MLICHAHYSIAQGSRQNVCASAKGLILTLQVLHPAIEKLFDHEVWAHWDNDLKLTCWHHDELQAFGEKADKWQKQRALISEEKQDRLRAKREEDA